MQPSVFCRPFQPQPHIRLHHHEHKEQEEQYHIDGPHVLHHPSPESQRQSVDHGQEAEHRVQYRNPGEVHTRTEMTHPLLPRRVIHVDGRRHQLHAVPGGKHQQFQFCLVAGGEQTQTVQFPQRIEPVARLRVVEPATRLHPQPEIRETVGKTTALRPFRSIHPSAAQNQRPWMLLIGLQHRGDVLRIVLTVAVQRDGIGKSHLQSLAEARLQRSTLTSVPVECHHRQALLCEAVEDAGRSVSAAVVHHDHIATLIQRSSHHTTDGSAVVIRRNHHTDTPLSEHLQLSIFVYR